MYNLGNSDKNTLALKYDDNKYYDENIVIDINDTNNTHSIIASRVKKKSVVLDVGCGAGYIGRLLINSECELYGIDLDQEALDVSKKIGCYKELFNLSITDEWTNEYKEFIKNENKFDYIIFADVLEHVVDPGRVIYKFSKLLKKNGKFLISVPNIAHIDIIKELANRTFNYNKIGVLDNTHLRFFTKKSFVDFIKNVNKTYKINFGVKLIGKTISEPWYLNNYPELFKIINSDNEVCVLQYVYELSNDSDFFENVDYDDNFSKIEIELQQKDKIELEKNRVEGEWKKLDIKNKELNDFIEKQHQTILNYEKEYEKLNNEKNRIEKEWSKLNNDIKLKNKEIESKDKKIKEQLITINIQKDKIKESNNFASELKLTIKDKNDIINEKKTQILELEKAVNMSENNYNNLKYEYDNLCVVSDSYKNEINRLLNSKSWKVTKPLRNVSGLIERKKK